MSVISKKEIKYSRSSIYGKMAMFLGLSESATGLQKMITPDKIVPFKDKKSGSTPQVMLDCVKGERLPSPNSQREINAFFPELRPWIDMPIWDILANDQIDGDEFQKLLFKIKNNVILKRILSNNYETYGLDAKTKRLTKTIEYLKFNGSFDALSALTVLLAKAESIKKITYKKELKDAISHVLLNISIRYLLQEEFQVLYGLYCKRFSYLWVSDNSVNKKEIKKSEYKDYEGLWDSRCANLDYPWYSIFAVFDSAWRLGLIKTRFQSSELIYEFAKLGHSKIIEKYDFYTAVYPDYYENVFDFLIEHFKVPRDKEVKLRQEYFYPN